MLIFIQSAGVTRSESEDHTGEKATSKGSILVDVTRREVKNRDISGCTKRTCILQKKILKVCNNSQKKICKVSFFVVSTFFVITEVIHHKK